MSDLDHTVYVLTLKKHVGGYEPTSPRDIIGGRFYETEREAREARREQDMSPDHVLVWPVDLRRPWAAGMAPR